MREYTVVIEEEGIFHVWVNIFPGPMLTDSAISAALDGYVESKFQFFGDAASLIQSKYVLLNGQKALEYEYVIEIDGVVSCYKGTCLVRGARLYAITVSCSLNTKKVAYGKHAEMVKSFRLIK